MVDLLHRLERVLPVPWSITVLLLFLKIKDVFLCSFRIPILSYRQFWQSNARKKKRQNFFWSKIKLTQDKMWVKLASSVLLASVDCSGTCWYFGCNTKPWRLSFSVYLSSSKIDIVGHISIMVGTSSKFLQHSSPPLQFCLCPAWLPGFPCSGSLPGYPSPFLKENIKWNAKSNGGTQKTLQELRKLPYISVLESQI